MNKVTNLIFSYAYLEIDVLIQTFFAFCTGTLSCPLNIVYQRLFIDACAMLDFRPITRHCLQSNSQLTVDASARLSSPATVRARLTALPENTIGNAEISS